jgi:hypothetical protein
MASKVTLRLPGQGKSDENSHRMTKCQVLDAIDSIAYCSVAIVHLYYVLDPEISQIPLVSLSVSAQTSHTGLSFKS